MFLEQAIKDNPWMKDVKPETGSLLGTFGGTSTPTAYNTKIYNNGYVPGPYEDITRHQNELARDQSGSEIIAKAQYRFANAFVFEVAKTFPIIGGLGMAAISAGTDVLSGREVSTADAFGWINNDMVQWLDERKKSIDDNYLPIYNSANYDQMNWAEQMATSNFWATQGADGLGFLAAMFTPGWIFKSMGIAAGGAKILNKLGTAAELLELGKKASKLTGFTDDLAKATALSAELGVDAQKVMEGISMYNKAGIASKSTANILSKLKPAWVYDPLVGGTSKIERGLDIGGTAFANGLVESAAEGNESWNNVKLKLESERAQGLNSYSNDEIKEIAGNAAATTFKYNLPLLMASNLLLETVILNKFDNLLGIGRKTAADATEDLRGLFKSYKGVKEGTETTFNEYLKKNLKPYATSDLLKEIGIKMPIAAIKEGLGEEGLQNSISRYSQRMAELNKETGILEDVNGILNQYATSFSDLGDNEFWQSVVLGAVLGGFGEAGAGTAFNNIINGGLKNNEYNRMLFGGEAQTSNKLMNILGRKEFEKEEGTISYIEQLGRLGLDFTDPSSFYEKDENGKQVLDENGKPKFKADAQNAMMATTFLTNMQLEELDKNIKDLESRRVVGNDSVASAINESLNQEVLKLQLQKEYLHDQILFKNLYPIFKMGVFAEDMANTILEGLVEKKKAKLKEENVLLGDDILNDKLKDFKDQWKEKFKFFEKVYKEVEEKNHYDRYYKPSKEDKDLYDKWKSKQISAMMSHLLISPGLTKEIEGLETFKSKYQTIKDDLGKLDSFITNLFSMSDQELIDKGYNQGTINKIKELKDIYNNTEEFEKQLEKEVDEEIKEEGRKVFKSLGDEELKDENGNPVSEEEFMNKYLNHQREVREEYFDQKTKRKKKLKSNYERKMQEKRQMKRGALVAQLSSDKKASEDLNSIEPGMKEMIDRLDKQGYFSRNLFSELDDIMEDIDQRINQTKREQTTTSNYYRKALRTDITKERFEKYRDAIKKNAEEKEEVNTNIKELVTMLEASNYVSAKEIRRYNALGALTTRTEKEQVEFNKLESKLKKDDGTLRKPEYDIIDGKLFVIGGNAGRLILEVVDTTKVKEALTENERKEYYKLVDKQNKSKTETDRLNQLKDKLKIKILIQTYVHKPKTDDETKIEKPPTFSTYAYLFNDTDMAYQKYNAIYWYNGQANNMTINSKKFWERFEVTNVNRGMKETFNLKYSYYKKLRERIKRITTIENSINNLNKSITNNQEHLDLLAKILNPFTENKVSNVADIEKNKARMLRKLIIGETYIINGKEFIYKGTEDDNQVFESADVTVKIPKKETSEKFSKGDIKRVNAAEIESTYAKKIAKVRNIMDKINDKIEELSNDIGAETQLNIVAVIEFFMRTNKFKTYAEALEKIEQVTDESKKRALVNFIKSLQKNYPNEELGDILKNKKVSFYYSIYNNKTKAFFLLNNIKNIFTDSKLSEKERIEKVKELIDQKTQDVEDDIENAKKVIEDINLSSAEFRRSDFELDKIYEEFKNKYFELEKKRTILNKLNKKTFGIESDGLFLGSTPQWISDIRVRESQLIALADKLQEILTKREEAIRASNSYTDERKEELVENTRKYISNMFKLLNELNDTLENQFIVNNAYKTLHYRSIVGDRNEQSAEFIFREDKSFTNKSRRAASMYTISTNDVEYKLTVTANNTIEIKDEYEFVDTEDGQVKILKMREDKHQQAFQQFLKQLKDINDYHIVNLGIAHFINTNVIKYNNGKFILDAEAAGKYAEPLRSIVDGMNEYIERLETEGVDVESTVRELTFANYVVAWDPKEGKFFSHNDAIAYTAIMEPSKRVDNVALDALYFYITTNDTLKNELAASVGTMSFFFEAMNDATLREQILSKVKRVFTQEMHNMSKNKPSILQMESFNRGFRTRAYKADGTRYIRNIDPSDEITKIFVAQPKGAGKSKEAGNTPNTNTSNSFYGYKYYGSVIAKFKDGTEELLNPRYVTENEAETVMALLLYKAFAFKIEKINGNRIAPFFGAPNQEYEKGLIQSIIRYGSVLKLPSNKRDNKFKWSKGRKTYVENNQPRPYDIWQTDENGKKIINWVDGDGSLHSINAEDIIKQENGKLIFNEFLKNFLLTKKVNVSAYADRDGKIAIPKLNKDALIDKVDGLKNGTNQRVEGVFSVTEYDKPSDFYAYGGDGIAPYVQISGVKNKPRVVGRTIRFSPAGTEFKFQRDIIKENRVLEPEPTEQNKDFVLLNDQDLEKLPDGSYQMKKDDKFFDFEMLLKKVIESKQELVIKSVIGPFREYIKDKKLSDNLLSPLGRFIETLEELHKAKKDKDLTAQIRKKLIVQFHIHNIVRRGSTIGKEDSSGKSIPFNETLFNEGLVDYLKILSLIGVPQSDINKISNILKDSKALTEKETLTKLEEFIGEPTVDVNMFNMLADLNNQGNNAKIKDIKESLDNTRFVTHYNKLIEEELLYMEGKGAKLDMPKFISESLKAGAKIYGPSKLNFKKGDIYIPVKEIINNSTSIEDALDKIKNLENLEDLISAETMLSFADLQEAFKDENMRNYWSEITKILDQIDKFKDSQEIEDITEIAYMKKTLPVYYHVIGRMRTEESEKKEEQKEETPPSEQQEAPEEDLPKSMQEIILDLIPKSKHSIYNAIKSGTFSNFYLGDGDKGSTNSFIKLLEEELFKDTDFKKAIENLKQYVEEEITEEGWKQIIEKVKEKNKKTSQKAITNILTYYLLFNAMNQNDVVDVEEAITKVLFRDC